MSTSSCTSRKWPVKPYEPRHAVWPYNDSDFVREDPTSDATFYSEPRFVTHIDDKAIATLREYYDAVLPRKGRILDLCSSWVSHYPKEIEDAAAKGELKVMGMGMNRAELAANKVLNNGRVVLDLNDKPDVAAALLAESVAQGTDNEKFDASTMVVSIDYLTQPLRVLQSLREVTKETGTVHLIISNRCFPTKVIDRWTKVSEPERLSMVGDFLYFAGWRKIEIVELSDGNTKDDQSVAVQGGLQGFMAMFGMNSRDPLWVVRAENE
ncbi:hypothetical protein BJ170DRAFT_380546 [Xylariales sp. AK1849]|nr:hypothetical protein BJ170DRAFT_380546 [Xylariales sp. AK1849]